MVVLFLVLQNFMFLLLLTCSRHSSVCVCAAVGCGAKLLCLSWVKYLKWQVDLSGGKCFRVFLLQFVAAVYRGFCGVVLLVWRLLVGV